MADNPFVDEHTVRVRAAPEDVWPVLAARLARWGTGFAPAYGTLIGVHPATATGTLPDPGATLPGFAVTAAEPPHRLTLTGRHRFSAYTLEFRLSEVDGTTTLTAHTTARFPGIAGRLYKLAVIDSQGHRFIVRRLLRGYVSARRAAVLFYAWHGDTGDEKLEAWLAQHVAGWTPDGEAATPVAVAAETPAAVQRLARAYGNPRLTIADYGYLVDLHPLEIWSAGELIRRTCGASDPASGFSGSSGADAITPGRPTGVPPGTRLRRPVSTAPCAVSASTVR